ncbi:MAG: AEC family transporter [Legionellales bacterium]|nr:AEC family transporter [Legionellales bacterium]
MTVLLTLFPLFLIMLLGFVLAKTQFFTAGMATMLTRLLFFVIMPVTLFSDIAKLPFQQTVNWPYMGGFFLSSMILMITVTIISHYIFHRDLKNIVLNAMSGAQVNTALLALPIFLALFHTVVPVAGIILVQALFNFLGIFLLEKIVKARKISLLHQIASIFLKTPILLGILLGIVCSGWHIELPQLVTSTCDLIKNSASFIALLALGLSLYTPKNVTSTRNWSEISLIICLKIVIHPLLAGVIGYYMLHLSTQNLVYLILMSAMPTAKNIYIISETYQVHPERANFIVCFTTIFSVVSLNLLLMLLPKI